ncbi:MAG: hypothetical protein FJ206_16185 [Gemmatimonadetes bacterium]|nr:hypothetical protein [Gemmatimonadota bacterium]
MTRPAATGTGNRASAVRVAAIAVSIGLVACAGPPSGPNQPSRHLLATVDGPLGPTVIGLIVGSGPVSLVGGWAQLPNRPSLRFVRGQGTADSQRLDLDLLFDDGTGLGRLNAAGGPERYSGQLLASAGGAGTATVHLVDALPTGAYVVAIDGAPDVPARGAVNFRCGPDGPRLLLVDPTGGQRLEVQVVAPGTRFRLGSFPLGRAGSGRGSIRLGGDPAVPLPFATGVVTVKQLDSLTLIGRIQGVARMGPAGTDVAINASVSAVGADGSCR